MIKKLEAEEIAKILTLKDDKLTQVFPCEVGEWTQFLMQHIDNPKFFMRGILEDEKLIGYLVAVNTISLFTGNRISILYSKITSIEIKRTILDELIEWGKEKKIKLIVTSIIEETDEFKNMGFIRTSINMKMEI